MMTPEETKNYIEHRLRELGWAARIDKSSYEKIYHFTDGTEAGANQVCYKLLSLGSLESSREITDELIRVALDDLTRMDDIVKRSAKSASQNGDGETDVVTIEQLAAVLEAKVTAGELPSEIWAPERIEPARPTVPPRVPGATKKPSSSSRSSSRVPNKMATAESVSVATPASTSSPKSTTGINKEKSPVITSADRIAPARPTSRAYRTAAPAQNSFMQRFYRFSSTATITLSATVLVVIAITMILFINRSGTHPTMPVGMASTSAGAVAAPAPTAVEAPPTLESTVPPPSVAADKPMDRSVSAPPVAATKTDAKEDEHSKAKVNSTAKPIVGAKATPPDQGMERGSSGTQAAVPVPAKPAAATDAAKTPTEPARAVESAVNNEAARTQTAAVDANPRTARPKISKEELASLLRRFAFVYEAGDLDQFVGMFSDNARTNDKSTRQGIREDYENFFRSTDLRQMNLGQVNWEVEDNQAQGWGNFDVTVRRSGEQEVQAYSGSLSFYVEKMDGRLRIVRLYHGQRRAGL